MATLALGRYLEDASLAGLAKVTVIHGLGTGALRDAVRSEVEEHLVGILHGAEVDEPEVRPTVVDRPGCVDTAPGVRRGGSVEDGRPGRDPNRHDGERRLHVRDVRTEGQGPGRERCATVGGDDLQAQPIRPRSLVEMFGTDPQGRGTVSEGPEVAQ